MRWVDVRKAYPDQWLVIEALKAHTTADNKRHLEDIAVIEQCDNSEAVMKTYLRHHRLDPSREFYFVHTSREELDIREQRWLGIRASHETAAS